MSAVTIGAAAGADSSDFIKTRNSLIDMLNAAKTQNRYNDDYKRLTSKLITVGSVAYDKGITYEKTRIQKVMDVKNGSTFHNVSYGYDALGRITSEADSVDTSFNNTYVYDAFGRLIQENNKALDKTFVFKYNDNGNIIGCDTLAYTTANVSNANVTVTHVYDSTIKDRLVKFNNISISYDANGCPTYYNGRNYTWTRGKLTRVYCGAAQQPGSLYADCKFTYDAYGRRLSKSYTHDPNPVSTSDYSYNYNTNYTYDNSGRLLREYCTEKYISGTTTTREFIYLYDESGMVGVLYSYNDSTPTPYYYHRNLQGDVIGIYDANGTQIVKYSYDAWGNCTVAASSVFDLANNNPIRYRGYYYDRETKLYYLNARYYNPEWRRFISPDDTAYLDPNTPNGLNLYAYCNNDPVNYADPSGNSVIAALLIGGALGGLTAYFENQDILTGILTGALLGASVGAIIGIGGAVLSGAISSVIGKATTDFFSVAFFGGEFGDWEDYAIAFAFGGITGHLGQFTNNLAKGSKFAFDVFGRPAVNQVVKFVLRGVPLNIDKYLYDVAIRSVTYGEFGYIKQFEFCGQNAKIDVLKCLIRATAKFIRPYTLKPRTMLPRLVYA